VGLCTSNSLRNYTCDFCEDTAAVLSTAALVGMQVEHIENVQLA